MKQIFKNLALMTITALLSLVVVQAVSSRQMVWADAKSDACQGVGLVTGSTTKDCGTDAQSTKSVNGVVSLVTNILSVVVGIIAVIMIIIGGFRFVLSGGDSNNTNSARNTVIYAIVGLVIVAIAQVLVRYVVNRVPSG